MSEPAPAASGGVFISYRREDTAYSAGWLFDRLSARLGPDRVFKDVDSIELGENFVDVIMAAVGSCDVLLALIGDRWLTVTDAGGNRRLDDPGDFVRLEIEAALSRDVRVIPILVDGATMPRADQLPTSLAKLVRFHGLELSPSRFTADTNRLLEALEPVTTGVSATEHPGPTNLASGMQPPPPGAAPPPSPQPPPPSRPSGGSSPSTRVMAILGGAVALLLLLLVVVVSDGGSESTTSSGSAPPATQPVRVVFADDFSGDAAGWEAEPGGAGSRVGGRYQVRVDPTAADRGVLSAPRKAAGVSPFAPEDVRIEVASHRISSTTSDASMGLACRVSDAGMYAFLVGADGVAIGKVVDGRLEQLNMEPLIVDLNAVIRLQAECRSDEGAQRLSFSVDGKPVLTAEDRRSPLSQGTVGLGAFVGEPGHSIVAEFDDLSVTAG